MEGYVSGSRVHLKLGTSDYALKLSGIRRLYNRAIICPKVAFDSSSRLRFIFSISDLTRGLDTIMASLGKMPMNWFAS